MDKAFQPRVYNTLNVPTIQLVFVNFYLGIARGRPGDGRGVHAHEEPRVAARRVDQAVEEPYVIDIYGDLTGQAVGRRGAGRPGRAGGPGHPRRRVERHAEQRGEHEVRVAAVKARATDVALEITSRMFEGTGAR